MAVRSVSLFFLQTVAAAPALLARGDAVSCPTSDGLTTVQGGKSWTIGCGKDAYGNDIGEPKSLSSFEECIQACGAETTCVSVAYEGKNCYLKSKTASKVDKASVWGAFLVDASSSGSSTGKKCGAKKSRQSRAPVAPSVPSSTAAVASYSAVIEPVASSAVAPSSPSAVAPIQKAKAPAASAGYVAASSAAASAQASSAPSAPSTGSDGSCARPAAKTLSTKRGGAYNSVGMLTPMSGKISWAYNWGAGSDGSMPNGVTYIPMLWGGDSARGNAFKAAAATAVAAGADTLLGFNEPDHSAQANMDAGAAVTAWKSYMEPLKCTARLAAPAVTNGGSPMGLTWLKSFLSACSDCTIDVVPIHWYDSASNVAYFKQYVQDAYTAGGNRPLWITEFGASGSDSEVASFLGSVLPWLDASPMVERYAYFMAGVGSGQLLSSASQLSTIGNAYCS